MKLDIVASSGNDEFYTPEYAILPLIKYLKHGAHIWCPFDTEDSLFVQVLTKAGFHVTHSHIKDGLDQDFFFMNPPSPCDYIISNPPYSLKTQVLSKLFTLGIPFAMLVGVVGLFESQPRFSMFRANEFEILYFNKRISYFKSYDEPKPSLNPPFSSVYVCHHILPKQIVFEELNIPSSKRG